MRTLISLLASASVLAGAPAVAAPTIFTNVAAFNAATTAQGVDTYDDLTPGDGADGPLARSAGSYGYTASSTAEFYYVPLSGSDIALGTNLPQGPIVLNTFLGGVSAIGGNFFNTNISNAIVPSTVTLTLVDASGSTTQTITNATATSFLGFVSTGPITSLTISSGASLYPSINNLVLAKTAAAAGPTVPEPATWAMMIAGFGVVGGTLRRNNGRRRSVAIGVRGA